jgi:hypothetical protein
MIYGDFLKSRNTQQNKTDRKLWQKMCFVSDNSDDDEDYGDDDDDNNNNNNELQFKYTVCT